MWPKAYKRPYFGLCGGAPKRRRGLSAATPAKRPRTDSSEQRAYLESERAYLESEFWSYYVSIPVDNAREIVKRLRTDRELATVETCGNVTEYIFDYVWQHVLRKDEEPPMITMYEENRSSYAYGKTKLLEIFPPIQNRNGDTDAIHFVFQGENGAWDDLTGAHYSHEYVVIQTKTEFWSCQAWVDKYRTRWNQINDFTEMRRVLIQPSIDMDKLRHYFHLNEVPEGFGERRRDVEEFNPYQ